MRILLVTSEPGWAEALRASLDPAIGVIPIESRQIRQNPALANAVDACFVAEAAGTDWTVDTLKAVSAITETPLFVLTDATRSQWDEAVLFAGAQQIFRRPLAGPVIQLAVTRHQRRRQPESPAVPAPVQAPGSWTEAIEQHAIMTVWRDFSRILALAGDRERLLNQYLDKLREVLRCSRMFLYLAQPAGLERVFRCAYVSGAERDTYEHFRLHLSSGVAHVAAERRTLVWRQRLRPESPRDTAAARELAVFGAEIAVPISGRDGLIGLLLLGPQVSGNDYLEPEMTALYQALEGLVPLLTGGFQPARPQQETVRCSGILQALPIAGAIVDQKLQLAETNAAFRTLLGRSDAVAYDELPPAWKNTISATVQSHAASARVELDHLSSGTTRKLRMSVSRLEHASDPSVGFLVTIEDVTPPVADPDDYGIQNLVQRVGEQLSNEFRNALTPVDIMVQLSRDSGTSRGDLERLSGQVAVAIHRLRRRIDDLSYLTQTAIIPESTTVSAIVRFARERIDDWLEEKHRRRIVWLNESSEIMLVADSRALALALAELIMNAIEACDDQQVIVSIGGDADTACLRVRNSGRWAPHPESSGFRHRPFVSAKSTGVGLGIEVASRVAEYHGGRLILGPIGTDTVEAILEVPLNLAVLKNPEMRIAVTGMPVRSVGDRPVAP